MQARGHISVGLSGRDTFTNALDQTLKHSRYFFRECNEVIENVAIEVLLIAGEVELGAHFAARTLCNQQEAGKIRGTAAFEALRNV
jgi:hypothetical protein